MNLKCMLQIACYQLHVAHCMLQIACCKLRKLKLRLHTHTRHTHTKWHCHFLSCLSQLKIRLQAYTQAYMHTMWHHHFLSCLLQLKIWNNYFLIIKIIKHCEKSEIMILYVEISEILLPAAWISSPVLPALHILPGLIPLPESAHLYQLSRTSQTWPSTWITSPLPALQIFPDLTP